MALHLPLICSCTELTCLELELGSTRNGLIVSCVGEWVCVVGPLQLKSIKQAVSAAAIAKSISAQHKHNCAALHLLLLSFFMLAGSAEPGNVSYSYDGWLKS